ncbi:Small glutamine-rich tetratricopeptide repeat-containing protein A, putative [Pediculus humanus corporis]|uniref:Small glutamine-rich tetratricopeptide repeat-containing protein A, putative n=1 Tax=Pediculus humanus subsp. corporis TaxID=121224 RepID=E0VG38_PEDHC|nr:Small glutamine-rich tetratricopeptide repeat-containing protein A, putative [Pediculus humanus corporis]EEB12344.1 Small glutamine-rich tetratricopeptide repeat-containing protein A, putative [Pediculus humanus corporis]
MSDNKKVVYSVIKFLKDELTSLSPEACESIEVAIQCLENAYEIHNEDPSLDVGIPLTQMFASHSVPTPPSKVATSAEKEEAENLKTEGNNLVKAEKFEEAIQCYTRAIELDPNNPVYYCNRAAAYSRLNNHQATIDDCKAALKIEPTYSKAYGRLGFAYSSLNMFQEAKQSYKKALELEPGNQNYINNLELNEGLRNMSEGSVNGGVNRVPNLQNFNLNAFFRNPSIMSFASQMMSDPAVQNMMSSAMLENWNGNGNEMEALLQVGHRVAEHVQNTNPELLEQLLQQMNSAASNPVNSEPKPN